MGFFSNSKSKFDREVISTENSIKFATFSMEITPNGFLKIEDYFNIHKIPLKHIDTVTYSIKDKKDSTSSANMNIIGKGVVLCTLTFDHKSDHKDIVQEWLLEKI